MDYDKQAADDAAAADKAAGNAEGYAKDARDSADQAELDADAAHAAAAQAEQDAKDARAAANRADTAATEAEQAAKDADKYSKEAQQAATEAETAEANKNVQTGASGIGGVFPVIDKITPRGEPEQLPNECHDVIVCDKLVFIAHFDEVVSYYLCLNPDVPATQAGCPPEDTVYLKTIPYYNITQKVKIYTWDMTVDVWKGIAKSIKGDFTGCYHKVFGGGEGSASDCAWAATWLPLGGPIGKVAEAIRAVDAAMRTGISVADAMKALRALDIDARALADIERSVSIYEEARTACRINSFPGTTEVVMADGSRKALRDVVTGDILLAADPATGISQGEPVTRTFHHTAGDLVEVTVTDGGRLTSTRGHRFFVSGRGWTLASDLRPGNALRTPDGVRTVAALADRHEAKPRTVYDLTVSGLHTFYAVAGDSPVLVHNCNDLAADAQKFPGQAHTLDEHVAGNVTPQRAKELAEAKTEKLGYVVPNSLFIDEQTAQQVVDYALANNANRIRKWLRGSDPELPLRGTFGARNSLGKAYYPDGTVKDAGNAYRIKLVRAKAHKSGYYVQTCFPE
ncbi:polymorphic toxin-type HINT domain-containing protein [Streptomyces sp. NPDC001406]|uniref:polymorphic toxin-type HINT domain-containing protein n=1 Tax=Streptomyces sp. NPDC001406 TaxID=3364572 RepID=UPI0036C6E997